MGTQNGRYVLIVDRDGNHSKSFLAKRKKDDDEKKDNEKKERHDCLYVFQPIREYGHCIDHDAMIESMHLNTLECLLPIIKNKNKQKRDDNFEEKFIGAKHFDKGEMICVSFH